MAAVITASDVPMIYQTKSCDKETWPSFCVPRCVAVVRDVPRCVDARFVIVCNKNLCGFTMYVKAFP